MKNIFVILIVLLLAVSCKEEVEIEAVATVNEEVLSLEEFKSYFPEETWSTLSFEAKREHINEWIKLTLLSQEADRSGLSDLPKVKSRIDYAVKNVKSNVVLAQRISEIQITDDDLFNYYKLHKSKYQETRKEFKIQRIFLKSKAKLDEVMEYLRKGESFTDVVKLHSEESLGASGGYTGFMGENDLQSSIWNSLIKLQKWHYTSAKIDKGYYIFRYYDTQEVINNKEFTEVEDDIRKIVFEQKRKEVFDNVIEELKREADISISL